MCAFSLFIHYFIVIESISIINPYVCLTDDNKHILNVISVVMELFQSPFFYSLVIAFVALSRLVYRYSLRKHPVEQIEESLDENGNLKKIYKKFR